MPRPLRIVFFGNFHPQTTRISTTSIGMVMLLASLPEVERIEVACPVGSRLPEGTGWEKVVLRPMWRHEDPLSVVRSLFVLLREARSTDVFLFNTYVTAFGRSKSANALGLMLPSLLAWLSLTPVVVYMHNFVETQQVELLGYQPSRRERWAAHLLEGLLLRRTTVVVPLESQRRVLLKEFGTAPRQLIIPHLEGIHSLAFGDEGPDLPPAVDTSGKVHVLLFGLWGPQKDLEGALDTLQRVRNDFHLPLSVIVAGPPHPTFPKYAEVYRAIRRQFESPECRFLGEVPERDLSRLIRQCTALVLPYHTAGGYSAAMNVGKAHGVEMIAWDIPEMREVARALDVPVAFVPARDAPALARALQEVVARPRGPGRDALVRSSWEGAMTGIRSLVQILCDAGQAPIEGDQAGVRAG